MARKDDNKKSRKERDAEYFSKYYNKNKEDYALQRRKQRINGLAEERLAKLKELKGDIFG